MLTFKELDILPTITDSFSSGSNFAFKISVIGFCDVKKANVNQDLSDLSYNTGQKEHI